MKPETIVSLSEAAASLAKRKKEEEEIAAAKKIMDKKYFAHCEAVKVFRLAKTSALENPSVETDQIFLAAMTAVVEAIEKFNIAERALQALKQAAR
jgi:hypothetical protein